ncbi:MAG: isochorismatase family protein [Legionellales bacterium]|nr:isochorismatase family protein [Legionellales bacterium]
MRIIAALVFAFIGTINCFSYAAKSDIDLQKIVVPVSVTSYFKLDQNGVLMLDNQDVPYAGKKNNYLFNTSLSNKDTAFFVVDPWDNMPSKFLNTYYGKITQNYILPLITAASAKGFHVYIFTNDCRVFKPKAYSCEISQKFHQLAYINSNVKILFWQNFDIDSFIKQLRNIGITKIVYTGYASNLCIIERPAGMVNMFNNGFSLYFIPKASAAMEVEGTWKNQKIHKAITQIISQSLAKIIQYNNIYQALVKVSKKTID